MESDACASLEEPCGSLAPGQLGPEEESGAGAPAWQPGGPLKRILRLGGTEAGRLPLAADEAASDVACASGVATGGTEEARASTRGRGDGCGRA